MNDDKPASSQPTPTPFQRFETLTKRLLAVPKTEVDKQKPQPSAKQPKKKPKPATK